MKYTNIHSSPMTTELQGRIGSSGGQFHHIGTTKEVSSVSYDRLHLSYFDSMKLRRQSIVAKDDAPPAHQNPTVHSIPPAAVEQSVALIGRA